MQDQLLLTMATNSDYIKYYFSIRDLATQRLFTGRYMFKTPKFTNISFKQGKSNEETWKNIYRREQQNYGQPNMVNFTGHLRNGYMICHNKE